MQEQFKEYWEQRLEENFGLDSADEIREENAFEAGFKAANNSIIDKNTEDLEVIKKVAKYGMAELMKPYIDFVKETLKELEKDLSEEPPKCNNCNKKDK